MTMIVQFGKATFVPRMYSFDTIKCDMRYTDRLPCIENYLYRVFNSVYFVVDKSTGIDRMCFNFRDRSDEAYFQLYIDQEIEI